MWARVCVLRTRTRRDALGEQRAKNPRISWDILGLCDDISWDILGYRVETARNRRMRWGLGWKLRDIVKLIRFVNQDRFPLLYCSLTQPNTTADGRTPPPPRPRDAREVYSTCTNTQIRLQIAESTQLRINTSANTRRQSIRDQ